MTMDWLQEREEGEEEEEREEQERRGQQTPSLERARVLTRPVSVAASPSRSPGPGAGAGPDWVPLGPSTVTIGQLEGNRQGRVSGRVSALAVSSDGLGIYAG